MLWICGKIDESHGDTRGYCHRNISTRLCVSLFFLFCVIWSILAWILFYFPICMFLFCEWMNERFSNHTTCCAVFVFLAVDVSYLVPHTPYRWRRVNIFCSLSDWNISFFFSCAHKNTETNNSSELLHIMNTGWFDNWFQIGRSPWSKSKESSL